MKSDNLVESIGAEYDTFTRNSYSAILSAALTLDGEAADFTNGL